MLVPSLGMKRSKKDIIDTCTIHLANFVNDVKDTRLSDTKWQHSRTFSWLRHQFKKIRSWINRKLMWAYSISKCAVGMMLKSSSAESAMLLHLVSPLKIIIWGTSTLPFPPKQSSHSCRLTLYDNKTMRSQRDWTTCIHKWFTSHTNVFKYRLSCSSSLNKK